MLMKVCEKRATESPIRCADDHPARRSPIRYMCVTVGQVWFGGKAWFLGVSVRKLQKVFDGVGWFP